MMTDTIQRLTLTEAAKQAGFSYSTIYRWVTEGVHGRKLPSSGVGARRFIDPDDLDAFLSFANHGGPPDPLPTARLLVDAAGAAAMASVSVRHWQTLDSSGKVPAPVRLGSAVRWSIPELEAWLRAGCPARERWDVIRERA